MTLLNETWLDKEKNRFKYYSIIREDKLNEKGGVIRLIKNNRDFDIVREPNRNPLNSFKSIKITIAKLIIGNVNNPTNNIMNNVDMEKIINRIVGD